MTQILKVPFHPAQPWRRRGRDALCALALAGVLFGALGVVLASRPTAADQAVDHGQRTRRRQPWGVGRVSIW